MSLEKRNLEGDELALLQKQLEDFEKQVETYRKDPSSFTDEELFKLFSDVCSLGNGTSFSSVELTIKLHKIPGVPERLVKEILKKNADNKIS